MHHSAIQQLIAPMIEPSLESMGYRLVRVIWQGSDKRRILQIMADRSDGAEMTVDHCAEISHTVSALLDVEDPIESAYELEVSSPGIDRPLMNEADLKLYKGHEVKVEMAIPQAGRRRYRGKIHDVDSEALLVKNGGEEFTLPMEDIGSVKLVLTDALMDATLKQAEARAATLDTQETDTTTQDNNANNDEAKGA